VIGDKVVRAAAPCALETHQLTPVPMPDILGPLTTPQTAQPRKKC